jgi:hypothetical protein
MSAGFLASRGRLVCRLVALLSTVGAVCLPVRAAASDAILYRIFLTDGSTVVSYGEFARVADRVVFSMPVGSVEDGVPDLQLVSVADASVDWARTERYADSVRAKRYAETRGEEEFARLSADVARTLSDVARTRDPKRRLEIATEARRMLAGWPAKNHGYRAQDVAQLSGLLDEVVSELRVAAGESRLDLALVVETAPLPPVPLMPTPGFRESIEQAFTVARITPESTERVSLLNSIVRALGPVTTEAWAAALHARAASDLNLELRTERAYADLVSRTMMAAEQRTRAADVKALEKLIRSVLQSDDRLGRRRPQATGALLATLDSRLADARRLRLERDAFAARLNTIQAYRRTIDSDIETFEESIEGLQEIRALAGPSSRTLGRLSERASKSVRRLTGMKPPADLHTVHGLLTSAFQMAGQAAAARQRAIQTTSMELAWQASSAAAGALMMFERANEELQKLAAPPKL